ncbi:MAG: quinol:cytochrome C oxidoreductase, partial [Acidobacteriota bacterium]
FSTIFGVYVFAGCVVSILSVVILVVLRLKSAGALTSVVTWEHFHDLGKLLFGFTVFWAYIGFSQFMLIWYANIPEETFWFELRWEDPSWQKLSIFLAVGHFVVPFFFLISQWVKRNSLTLTIAALWMLGMHYVDMYWLVMPTAHHGEFHPNLLLDITCWLGIGGLFIAVFLRLMQRNALVPIHDPRLGESLAFENP